MYTRVKQSYGEMTVKMKILGKASKKTWPQMNKLNTFARRRREIQVIPEIKNMRNNTHFEDPVKHADCRCMYSEARV